MSERRIYSTHADGSPAVQDSYRRDLVEIGTARGAIVIINHESRAILAGLADALGCVAMPRELWERVAREMSDGEGPSVALLADLRALGLLTVDDAPPLPSATCERCGRPWPCPTRGACEAGR